MQSCVILDFDTLNLLVDVSVVGSCALAIGFEGVDMK